MLRVVRSRFCQRTILTLSRSFCKADQTYNNQSSDPNTALETAKDLKSELRKVYWRLKLRTTSFSVLAIAAFVYEFYPVSVVSSLVAFQSWMGSKTHPLHSDLVLSLKLSAKDPSQVELTTFKKKKITAKIDTIIPATEVIPAYRALQSRLKKNTPTETSGSEKTIPSSPVGFESDESAGALGKLLKKGDLGRIKLLKGFVEDVRGDINGCYADIAQGQTLKFVDHPDRFFFYFRVAEKPFLLTFHYADEQTLLDIELLFRILNGNRPLKLKKEVDLTQLVSAEEEEYFLLGGKKKVELGEPIGKPAAAIGEKDTKP